MNTEQFTIDKTIDELRRVLSEYIEATYHVSDPSLVAQRRRILEQVGNTYQVPYLESTPRYKAGRRLKDLGLHQAALQVFDTVSQAGNGLRQQVYDPPYEHQSDAIVKTLVEDKSILVMTGTGSGKTECFLFPILGKLAREASEKPKVFAETNAVRALVLYPMNALVNDQLGRLRLLFGDPRIVAAFKKLAGRPPRFARYTSRTLYPGVRTAKKDQSVLVPIDRFYVQQVLKSRDKNSPESGTATDLITKLKERGKWPAKDDIAKWYGKKGDRWIDPKTQEFKRCITMPDDVELLTRHEVIDAPPDILITNYSMLEYMMMRPIERPIFEKTKEWLDKNPDEKLLLIIDEAHLYRGAAGTEVSLLLRRFRARLGIPEERLQVICTSASFSDADQAAAFGVQLAGKRKGSFEVVKGQLELRKDPKQGTREEAEVLAKIDLNALYASVDENERIAIVAPFLAFRKLAKPWELQRSLYAALEDFSPMSLLVNVTMTEARSLEYLAENVFNVPDREVRWKALTALIALGSLAKRKKGEPGLLPCRIHAFHRGLPGLWVCVNKDCTELEPSEKNGITGKLYGQPRDTCRCGSRVFELYTCRNCGSAYARAYTNDLSDPDFLWSEPGGAFSSLNGFVDELEPLDLLLEQPVLGQDAIEPADLDLETGRLNPKTIGTKVRSVFLKQDRTFSGLPFEHPGEFKPCAVCGQRAGYGRSSVQDLQTKGDQPFQALISKQIQIQPPASKATDFAPLRGRKVLIFSDSRQTAARLAPNLQNYSNRDVLRPLIVSGFSTLESIPVVGPLLCLQDLYLAVLIAAKRLGVRFRMELRPGETASAVNMVEQAIKDGALTDPSNALQLLSKIRMENPPESLLLQIRETLTNEYYGLESLALASLRETEAQRDRIVRFPNLTDVATTAEEKLALARLWIRCWHDKGFWLSCMPLAWWMVKVQHHTGRFQPMERFLAVKGASKAFDRQWLPQLLKMFAEEVSQDKYRLKGSELSLQISGSWSYCRTCKTVFRTLPNSTRCINCLQETSYQVDPDRDPVFAARKKYYRASTVEALQTPPITPMSIVAAEHTAQLNTAQADQVFSTAEENELLFQDVEIQSSVNAGFRSAIDVLSCTTTMEVGIDIGALSAVALRNMPPMRANYQQRSGRAGRRGDSVATVLAFGSADSHDEHYFSRPDQMIRGPVQDPILILDNSDIAERHVTAYLLQRYHQARLPNIRPEQQPSLFAVLGSVEDFKKDLSILNRKDLEAWLKENEKTLRNDLDSWLPVEINAGDRLRLLRDFVNQSLNKIDEAIIETSVTKNPNPEPPLATEATPEANEENPRADGFEGNLLDRFLYKGILPRYAFPTDVASFYVFDTEQTTTTYRPVFRFTPSQGLPVALSQYAPGKLVWIGGSQWHSGAIYSPMQDERSDAWKNKRLYYECSVCHYAKTMPLAEGTKGEKRDCESCGSSGTFGESRFWLRPPGFAHPSSEEPNTSPDDQPGRSYATRAKLTAPTPADPSAWKGLNGRLRTHSLRQHLLVTNRGPRDEGYNYCTKCGLIEPSATRKSVIFASHRKPYPDDKEPNCPGNGGTRGIVLGTDFVSDVLLVSIRVESPLTLRPDVLATDVALRTLCESLTKAACALLELESSELQAEYRLALTPLGRQGLESEIYLYDTLPGGAGFARRAGDLGLSLFEKALAVLECCPDGCDRSCYRCLRSYKNKFEHDLIDRYLGSYLLRYLLYGTIPNLDPKRIEADYELLFQDLERTNQLGISIHRNANLVIEGIGNCTAPIFIQKGNGEKYIVGLQGSMTPNEPLEPQLKEIIEYSASVPVILVDDLKVRRNLPRATTEVLEKLIY
jgi:ATP-dependent helicase YprA (DUF1998 family)